MTLLAWAAALFFSAGPLVFRGALGIAPSAKGGGGGNKMSAQPVSPQRRPLMPATSSPLGPSASCLSTSAAAPAPVAGWGGSEGRQDGGGGGGGKSGSAARPNDGEEKKGGEGRRRRGRGLQPRSALFLAPPTRTAPPPLFLSGHRSGRSEGSGVPGVGGEVTEIG